MPSIAAEFTVIVEAYQEVTGVQNHLFSVTRDTDSSPRVHARIMTTANTSMVTYDDANALSLNIPSSAAFPLVTSRFNRYGFAFKAGDMKLMVNGQRTNGNAVKSGVIPSGLTRLRIGHDSNPLVDQNPMVIRSIVVIPRAVSHNDLIALTF